MTNLEKIKRLLPWLQSNEGIRKSYKIIDGKFVHMNYGWQVQYVKVFDNDEDLKLIFEYCCLVYANEMRVNKKLIINSFKE